jgi:hypothetical protein
MQLRSADRRGAAAPVHGTVRVTATGHLQGSATKRTVIASFSGTVSQLCPPPRCLTEVCRIRAEVIGGLPGLEQARPHCL